MFIIIIIIILYFIPLYCPQWIITTTLSVHEKPVLMREVRRVHSHCFSKLRSNLWVWYSRGLPYAKYWRPTDYMFWCYCSFTRQRRNALQASTERREVCVEFGHLPENSACVSFCHCSLPSTCVEMDFVPKAVVLQGLVCLSFAVSMLW